MRDQSDGRVEDRMAALERRLARLEARLGLAPDDVPGPGAGDGTSAEVELRADEAPAPGAPPVEPALMAELNRLAPRRVPTPPPLPRQHLAPVVPPVPQAATPIDPASLAIPYERKAAPQPEAAVEGSFEQTIGLKWAGWVGAVVVVIGAGLGIKFAYDQGWFLILPPLGRLVLMSLGGVALIAAGEYVFRRVHIVAATGLYGAGVATQFLVAYAGHAYYQLYAREAALVFMSAVTLVGALIAVRGDLLSIAVLALIGGNLAPLVLRVSPGEPVALLSYLATLQVVALVLAWRGREPKWWTLRVGSLATTSLWVAVLLAYGARRGFDPATLPFVLAYASLYQLELILSTWHGQLTRADGARRVEAINTGGSPVPREADRWVGVAFSAVVTGLLVLAILVITHGDADVSRGAWVLGIAAAYTLVGYAIWRGAGADRDAAQTMSIGFRAQAAALVVVAVPVLLSGVWVVVGWAGLSLAFATAGAVLHLRVSRWAGVAVWRLAVLALGWWAVDPTVPVAARVSHAAWFQWLGTDVRAYTVMAWVVALVGHAVAWIIHAEGLGSRDDAPARKVQRLFWVTSGMAALVWIAGSIAGLPPAGATFAVVVYAWLLLVADVLNPRLRVAILAAAVLAIATAKWVAVDILAARLSPDWSPLAYAPVLNPVMGVGLLLAGTILATYWRRRAEWPALLSATSGDVEEPAEGRALLLAVAGVVVVLLTIALSAEIDRVIEQAGWRGRAAGGFRSGQLLNLAWTVLWAAATAAFAGLVVWLEPDRLRRTGPLRLVGVVAVLLALKFLVVDTLAWRILSRPAPVTPWVNLQTLAAAVVFGGLLGAWWLLVDHDPVRARRTLRVAGFLAVLVPLWAVTFELDRVFRGMAQQFAFSIFWSAASIGLVVAGFRFRVAGLRYFGLGLFAFTLLKVVFVDLSEAGTGWRVLSFLGLGLLLLGTSVVYGKVSPRLLGEGRGGLRTGD